MKTTLLATTAAILIALTGCTTAPSAPQTDDADRTSATETLRDLRHKDDFNWLASAAAPGTDLYEMVTTHRAYVWTDFPQDVHLAYFNGTWTCSAADCPLKMVLWPPGECCGPPNTPHASIVGQRNTSLIVHEPAAGQWVAQFYPETAATVQVDGHAEIVALVATHET